MNAIQFDSKATDQPARGQIRQEANVLPLRSAGVAPGEEIPYITGDTFHAKALAVFKGALIIAAILFVTISLALHAVARFS